MAMSNDAPTGLSAAVEDYLKQICKLELAGEAATTSALARRLGVTAASVTGMTKRLAGLGLLERTPYRGVVLTPDGRRAALEILRHHRLLEQFLAVKLGLSLEAAHAEAERLEHAISENLERRIDEALGFPVFDPHGDPIPGPTLTMTEPTWRVLTDLAPGEVATIRRVPDSSPPLLRYLESLSLVPGQGVELVLVAPLGGPVTVRVGGQDHALGRDVAESIDVT